MNIYDLSKKSLPEAEIFIQVHYKQIKTPKFFQNQTPQITPQISVKYTTNKPNPQISSDPQIKTLRSENSVTDSSDPKPPFFFSWARCRSNRRMSMEHRTRWSCCC